MKQDFLNKIYKVSIGRTTKLFAYFYFEGSGIDLYNLLRSKGYTNIKIIPIDVHTLDEVKDVSDMALTNKPDWMQ